jgi:hypothetical protein
MKGAEGQAGRGKQERSKRRQVGLRGKKRGKYEGQGEGLKERGKVRRGGARRGGKQKRKGGSTLSLRSSEAGLEQCEHCVARSLILLVGEGRDSSSNCTDLPGACKHMPSCKSSKRAA